VMPFISTMYSSIFTSFNLLLLYESWPGRLPRPANYYNFLDSNGLFEVADVV
jgi:hypothetical protein